MRLSPRLEGPVTDAPSEERTRAAHAWRALRSEPDELGAGQAELARMDRALVQSRRQTVAARAEAVQARDEARQLRDERFAPSTVWSLGALALASAGGWIYTRRKLLGLHGEPASMTMPPRRTEPAALPAPEPVEAAGPAEEGDFDNSDLQVGGDEADQWIAGSAAALPEAVPLPRRAA